MIKWRTIYVLGFGTLASVALLAETPDFHVDGPLRPTNNAPLQDPLSQFKSRLAAIEESPTLSPLDRARETQRANLDYLNATQGNLGQDTEREFARAQALIDLHFQLNAPVQNIAALGKNATFFEALYRIVSNGPTAPKKMVTLLQKLEQIPPWTWKQEPPFSFDEVNELRRFLVKSAVSKDDIRLKAAALFEPLRWDVPKQNRLKDIQKDWINSKNTEPEKRDLIDKISSAENLDVLSRLKLYDLETPSLKFYQSLPPTEKQNLLANTLDFNAKFFENPKVFSDLLGATGLHDYNVTVKDNAKRARLVQDLEKALKENEDVKKMHGRLQRLAAKAVLADLAKLDTPMFKTPNNPLDDLCEHSLIVRKMPRASPKNSGANYTTYEIGSFRDFVQFLEDSKRAEFLFAEPPCLIYAHDGDNRLRKKIAEFKHIFENCLRDQAKCKGVKGLPICWQQQTNSFYEYGAKAISQSQTCAEITSDTPLYGKSPANSEHPEDPAAWKKSFDHAEQILTALLLKKPKPSDEELKKAFIGVGHLLKKSKFYLDKENFDPAFAPSPRLLQLISDFAPHDAKDAQNYPFVLAAFGDLAALARTIKAPKFQKAPTFDQKVSALAEEYPGLSHDEKAIARAYVSAAWKGERKGSLDIETEGDKFSSAKQEQLFHNIVDAHANTSDPKSRDLNIALKQSKDIFFQPEMSVHQDPILAVTGGVIASHLTSQINHFTFTDAPRSWLLAPADMDSLRFKLIRALTQKVVEEGGFEKALKNPDLFTLFLNSALLMGYFEIWNFSPKEISDAMNNLKKALFEGPGTLADKLRTLEKTNPKVGGFLREVFLLAENPSYWDTYNAIVDERLKFIPRPTQAERNIILGLAEQKRDWVQEDFVKRVNIFLDLYRDNQHRDKVEKVLAEVEHGKTEEDRWNAFETFANKTAPLLAYHYPGAIKPGFSPAQIKDTLDENIALTGRMVEKLKQAKVDRNLLTNNDLLKLFDRRLPDSNSFAEGYARSRLGAPLAYEWTKKFTREQYDAYLKQPADPKELDRLLKVLARDKTYFAAELAKHEAQNHPFLDVLGNMEEYFRQKVLGQRAKEAKRSTDWLRKQVEGGPHPNPELPAFPDDPSKIPPDALALFGYHAEQKKREEQLEAEFKKTQAEIPKIQEGIRLNEKSLREIPGELWRAKSDLHRQWEADTAEAYRTLPKVELVELKKKYLTLKSKEHEDWVIKRAQALQAELTVRTLDPLEAFRQLKELRASTESFETKDWADKWLRFIAGSNDLDKVDLSQTLAVRNHQKMLDAEHAALAFGPQNPKVQLLQNERWTKAQNFKAAAQSAKLKTALEDAENSGKRTLENSKPTIDFATDKSFQDFVRKKTLEATKAQQDGAQAALVAENERKRLVLEGEINGAKKTIAASQEKFQTRVAELDSDIESLSRSSIPHLAYAPVELQKKLMGLDSLIRAKEQEKARLFSGMADTSCTVPPAVGKPVVFADVNVPIHIRNRQTYHSGISYTEGYSDHMIQMGYRIPDLQGKPLDWRILLEDLKTRDPKKFENAKKFFNKYSAGFEIGKVSGDPVMGPISQALEVLRPSNLGIAGGVDANGFYRNVKVDWVDGKRQVVSIIDVEAAEKDPAKKVDVPDFVDPEFNLAVLLAGLEQAEQELSTEVRSIKSGGLIRDKSVLTKIKRQSLCYALDAADKLLGLTREIERSCAIPSLAETHRDGRWWITAGLYHEDFYAPAEKMFQMDSQSPKPTKFMYLSTANPPLGSETLKTIQRWIESAAKNNPEENGKLNAEIKDLEKRDRAKLLDILAEVNPLPDTQMMPLKQFIWNALLPKAYQGENIDPRADDLYAINRKVICEQLNRRYGQKPELKLTPEQKNIELATMASALRPALGKDGQGRRKTESEKAEEQLLLGGPLFESENLNDVVSDFLCRRMLMPTNAQQVALLMNIVPDFKAYCDRQATATSRSACFTTHFPKVLDRLNELRTALDKMNEKVKKGQLKDTDVPVKKDRLGLRDRSQNAPAIPACREALGKESAAEALTAALIEIRHPHDSLEGTLAIFGASLHQTIADTTAYAQGGDAKHSKESFYKKVDKEPCFPEDLQKVTKEQRDGLKFYEQTLIETQPSFSLTLVKNKEVNKPLDITTVSYQTIKAKRKHTFALLTEDSTDENSFVLTDQNAQALLRLSEMDRFALDTLIYSNTCSAFREDMSAPPVVTVMGREDSRSDKAQEFYRSAIDASGNWKYGAQLAWEEIKAKEEALKALKFISFEDWWAQFCTANQPVKDEKGHEYVVLPHGDKERQYIIRTRGDRYFLQSDYERNIAKREYEFENPYSTEKSFEVKRKPEQKCEPAALSKKQIATLTANPALPAIYDELVHSSPQVQKNYLEGLRRKIASDPDGANWLANLKKVPHLADVFQSLEAIRDLSVPQLRDVQKFVRAELLRLKTAGKPVSPAYTHLLLLLGELPYKIGKKPDEAYSCDERQRPFDVDRFLSETAGLGGPAPAAAQLPAPVPAPGMIAPAALPPIQAAAPQVPVNLDRANKAEAKNAEQVPGPAPAAPAPAIPAPEPAPIAMPFRGLFDNMNAAVGDAVARGARILDRAFPGVRPPLVVEAPVLKDADVIDRHFKMLQDLDYKKKSLPASFYDTFVRGLAETKSEFIALGGAKEEFLQWLPRWLDEHEFPKNAAALTKSDNLINLTFGNDADKAKKFKDAFHLLYEIDQKILREVADAPNHNNQLNPEWDKAEDHLTKILKSSYTVRQQFEAAVAFHGRRDSDERKLPDLNWPKSFADAFAKSADFKADVLHLEQVLCSPKIKLFEKDKCELFKRLIQKPDANLIRGALSVYDPDHYQYRYGENKYLEAKRVLKQKLKKALDDYSGEKTFTTNPTYAAWDDADLENLRKAAMADAHRDLIEKSFRNRSGDSQEKDLGELQKLSAQMLELSDAKEAQIEGKKLKDAYQNFKLELRAQPAAEQASLLKKNPVFDRMFRIEKEMRNELFKTSLATAKKLDLDGLDVGFFIPEENILYKKLGEPGKPPDHFEATRLDPTQAADRKKISFLNKSRALLEAFNPDTDHGILKAMKKSTADRDANPDYEGVRLPGLGKHQDRLAFEWSRSHSTLNALGADFSRKVDERYCASQDELFKKANEAWEAWKKTYGDGKKTLSSNARKITDCMATTRAALRTDARKNAYELAGPYKELMKWRLLVTEYEEIVKNEERLILFYAESNEYKERRKADPVRYKPRNSKELEIADRRKSKDKPEDMGEIQYVPVKELEDERFKLSNLIAKHKTRVTEAMAQMKAAAANWSNAQKGIDAQAETISQAEEKQLALCRAQYKDINEKNAFSFVSETLYRSYPQFDPTADTKTITKKDELLTQQQEAFISKFIQQKEAGEKLANVLVNSPAYGIKSAKDGLSTDLYTNWVTNVENTCLNLPYRMATDLEKTLTEKIKQRDSLEGEKEKNLAKLRDDWNITFKDGKLDFSKAKLYRSTPPHETLKADLSKLARLITDRAIDLGKYPSLIDQAIEFEHDYFQEMEDNLFTALTQVGGAKPFEFNSNTAVYATFDKNSGQLSYEFTDLIPLKDGLDALHKSIQKKVTDHLGKGQKFRDNEDQFALFKRSAWMRNVFGNSDYRTDEELDWKASNVQIAAELESLKKYGAILAPQSTSSATDLNLTLAAQNRDKMAYERTDHFTKMAADGTSRDAQLVWLALSFVPIPGLQGVGLGAKVGNLLVKAAQGMQQGVKFHTLVMGGGQALMHHLPVVVGDVYNPTAPRYKSWVDAPKVGQTGDELYKTMAMFGSLGPATELLQGFNGVVGRGLGLTRSTAEGASKAAGIARTLETVAGNFAGNYAVEAAWGMAYEDRPLWNAMGHAILPAARMSAMVLLPKVGSKLKFGIKLPGPLERFFEAGVMMGYDAGFFWAHDVAEKDMVKQIKEEARKKACLRKKGDEKKCTAEALSDIHDDEITPADYSSARWTKFLGQMTSNVPMYADIFRKSQGGHAELQTKVERFIQGKPVKGKDGKPIARVEELLEEMGRDEAAGERGVLGRSDRVNHFFERFGSGKRGQAKKDLTDREALLERGKEALQQILPQFKVPELMALVQKPEGLKLIAESMGVSRERLEKEIVAEFKKPTKVKGEGIVDPAKSTAPPAEPLGDYFTNPQAYYALNRAFPMEGLEGSWSRIQDRVKKSLETEIAALKKPTSSVPEINAEKREALIREGSAMGVEGWQDLVTPATFDASQPVHLRALTDISAALAGTQYPLLKLNPRQLVDLAEKIAKGDDPRFSPKRSWSWLIHTYVYEQSFR